MAWPGIAKDQITPSSRLYLRCVAIVQKIHVCQLCRINSRNFCTYGMIEWNTCGLEDFVGGVKPLAALPHYQWCIYGIEQKKVNVKSFYYVYLTPWSRSWYAVITELVRRDHRAGTPWSRKFASWSQKLRTVIQLLYTTRNCTEGD